MFPYINNILYDGETKTTTENTNEQYLDRIFLNHYKKVQMYFFLVYKRH